ncbi:uncharacterized protein LOC123468017 [Daphnia magna]|uniref:uncharacterized protein LOC123468017 n=1 Tax=Daphnia magna TaxID=35525 RepID=UPI001E1BB90B|nr:uncharacterized protein LOC123468017 [Daphnia magna]
MASVATLTSKRGGNRGAVTRLITKLSDIITDATMHRDRKIYELNKKLEDLHDKIKVVEAAEVAPAAAASAAAAAAANPNPPAPTITPTINVTTATDSSHLPKFNLPEFGGNILLWNAFWDVFEVEVHLKKSYSNATNVLGQPAKIIMAHMRALVALPKPGTDRASLRKFVDSLESHIRGLEALNKTPDSYGDLLVCILLDKLSADLRRNLARQSDAAEWDLDILRKSLLKEIEILEDSESSISHSSALKPPKKTNVMLLGAKPSTKEFPHRKLFCPFCTGDHWPTDCDTAKTVEERYDIAKVKKLCFNCLRKMHQASSDCPSKYRCRVCNRAHHTSLHKADPSRVTGATILSWSPPTSVVLSATDVVEQNSFVFLETAIAKVQSQFVKLDGNILVDKGAQRTFITSKLAKLLNLPPLRRESLILFGFTSCRGVAEHYDVVQFSIIDRHGSPIVVQAIVIPHIVDPLSDPHRAELLSLPHLKRLKLAHPVSTKSTFEVDILVGADTYWNIVGDQVIRGSGPTAVDSKIGYLISGRLQYSGEKVEQKTVGLHISVEEALDVTKFWNLETLGIQPDLESTKTTEFYQKNSVEFRDGKYVAKLPWSENHPPLSSNLQVCQKRTRGTVNRLASKNPNGLKLYSKIILEQLDRGFIEKVPSSEMSKPSHYIPHFGVFKESATTPLRIVYDCSCKTSAGVSLNDCLEIGPPLQNVMMAILLRFRAHTIGLTADIEKAFHQVGLHEQDRDFVRFLWLKDPYDSKSDFESYRFRVIPFGASSSPFILLSVIKKHLQDSSSLLADDINRNIYVDNLISGCETSEDAVSYFSEANNVESSKSEGVGDKSQVTKVLGLDWEREEDRLHVPCVKLSHLSHPQTSKREVLRGISATYDPLGFITPLTIPARMLIQEIWKLKLDWDDPIPFELIERWKGIATSIEDSKTSFNRSYFKTGEIKELHVFVDASQLAYGAVAYFCNDDSSSFVFSKSRVAPLKTEKKLLTIPQTELMAAVIGTRVASSILSALLPLGLKPNCYLWSDSQIVLYWIQKMGKIKCQFVHNRVETIRSFTRDTNASWNYCPTTCNPADLLSRGSTLRQFLSSDIWLTGPSWLPKRSEWPSWEGNCEPAAVFHLSVITSASASNTPPSHDGGIGKILDISRYKFSYLIRVTAIVRRFVGNIKLKDKSRASWKLGYITVSELQEAEKVWLLAVQKSYFTEEINYCVKPTVKRPALVSQLDLFIGQDGLLRCNGRLSNSQLKKDAKHPILLPKNSTFSTLVIAAHHALMMHGGVKLTVASIRQRYWIPQIVQSVKKCLKKCVNCSRVRGPPYTAPNHAPLPVSRSSYSFPFTVTGIDFTGAFTIRGPKEAPKVDRTVYILLFTCASTRAIHLEVVEDMTTLSFLDAFRCFVSHHSRPAVIMAPWYGGFWERLIGLAKSALSKILGRTKPTLSAFRALVADAEVVLNDRPLENPSSSIGDVESLSPAHLMYGRRLNTLPYSEETNEEKFDASYGEKPDELKRAITRHQTLLQHFEKRFLASYLPALREYHQATKKNNPTVIKERDVVLVHDEKPRKDWKMAVVEKLIRSQDGQIRAADIRTANGKTNRPISKLYPLQVAEPSDDPAASSDGPLSDPAPSSPSRPTRKCAAQTNAAIKKIFEQEDAE